MISIPEERKVFMISYMKDLIIIIQTLIDNRNQSK